MLEIVTSLDFARNAIVANDDTTDLWVAAWWALIVPVQIDKEGATLHWEFDTFPKVNT